MPTRPVGTMTFSVPELDPGPFRTTAGTPHSPAGSTVSDRRQRQARSGPTYQSPKKRHCAAEPETPKPETPNRLQTNILILILGNEYEHKPSKFHPMNRTTHIRRSFFWKFALVLGAYRLLVHPGPNASPSYLALNMAGVILLSWIISYVYATWIRQKIARYDRIRPDMEPGEVLLAGSAATYGLHGGRLVLTDRRLIFVGSIFGKKKTVFALLSASVAALDPSGRYGLRLTTTEGRKLTFRLVQASSSLRHAFVRTAHENSL